MIFMLTIWIPIHKGKEAWDIAMKGMSKGLPKSIKKWQIFGCADGLNGTKMYELIFTEKGKADEATIDLVKALRPLDVVEGFNYKIEPILGMKDMTATM